MKRPHLCTKKALFFCAVAAWLRHGTSRAERDWARTLRSSDGQRLSERKSEPNKQTHRSTVSLRKARFFLKLLVGPSAYFSAPGLQNRAGAAAQDLSDAGRPRGGRGEIPRSAIYSLPTLFTDTTAVTGDSQWLLRHFTRDVHTWGTRVYPQLAQACAWRSRAFELPIQFLRCFTAS